MNVYEPQSITELLSHNAYPGRGILLGTTADGLHSVIAYFIMGRSANSRNRVFEETSDGIRTRAHDPSKLEDPSLIIYHPVRQVGKDIIVTNGDQTDTIQSALLEGGCFEGALSTREFEPDAPNFTPRISGIVYPNGNYTMSILKSADALGSACSRQFFVYPSIHGVGHFLHTYHCDGQPLPTFIGEPKRVWVEHNLDLLADSIWNSLNLENKISLYVSFYNIKTGEIKSKIINKHE